MWLEATFFVCFVCPFFASTRGSATTYANNDDNEWETKTTNKYTYNRSRNLFVFSFIPKRQRHSEVYKICFLRQTSPTLYEQARQFRAVPESRERQGRLRSQRDLYVGRWVNTCVTTHCAGCLVVGARVPGCTQSLGYLGWESSSELDLSSHTPHNNMRRPITRHKLAATSSYVQVSRFIGNKRTLFQRGLFFRGTFRYCFNEKNVIHTPACDTN